MPRLENWSVCHCDDNPFLAPECIPKFLVGDVYGHPDFGDGQTIDTSFICRVEGDSVFTRSGTQYTLGATDPTYESMYPNARERLLSEKL